MLSSARTIPALDEVIHIARCPTHGLHGERTDCFVCGGPVEQVAMVPLIEVDGQPCECGCGRPRRGQSRFHEDACRTRHWKVEVEYVHPESAAARNARNGAHTVKSRGRRRSGRQLSYRRAIRVVAGWLADEGFYSEERAVKVAERVLYRALPTKQRHPRPRVKDLAA